MGREKLLSFGIYTDVGLKEASQDLDASRKLLAQGVDLGEPRQKSVSAVTWLACGCTSFKLDFVSRVGL